ncbi:MAG: phosphatidylinositol-specific phospholipase C-like proteinputative carbohydrate-binding protein [Rhizobacter sp.]|nr:phosphatidylinositol-specific phospholipase C-like proteinputative carbohydrate-binding protein [Rhizobacter sp.]
MENFHFDEVKFQYLTTLKDLMPWKKLTSAILLAIMASTALASKIAYDHDPRLLETTTENWMKPLADNLPITALSIPGTHDSLGTDHQFSHDSQSASLRTQLDIGIRAVELHVHDTRIRFLAGGSQVEVYHALEDNLYIIIDWLSKHPSETVLVKVDGSLNQAQMTDAMATAWNHPDFAPHFWRPGSANPAVPTLGVVRGKMVLIQVASIRHMNLSFVEENGNSRFRVQENDYLSTNWMLWDKWMSVKAYLWAASDHWLDGYFYTNSLHGWGGTTAWFVASGNVTWATGSPNLVTGYTSRYGNNGWEDFPRATCTFDEGFCWIFFEGVNSLTQSYIETAKPNHVGIVRANFPGRGLINAIIDINRSTAPPVQLAWGDTDRCVDVKGGVTTGSSEIVSNVCDARSPSQQWLFAGDGLIRSFADPLRCVAASAGQAAGARLRFTTCDLSNSPYFLRAGSNHLALDSAPGLCIEPLDGRLAQGTPLQLGSCVASAARQSFVARRLAVPLVAGDTLCLEFAGQQAMANARTCVNGLDRQQWLLAEDGTLRSALSLTGCITFRPEDPTRQLINEYCAASAPQHWEARPDGTLRPQTRRDACLTLSDKGTATVDACTPGAITQRLAFHREPVQFRWHTDRCLSVNSQPSGSDKSAMARPCKLVNIGWRHLADQTIRVAAPKGSTATPENGQCLGLAGSLSIGASVVTGACVPGTATQRWSSMPDRSLRPASNLDLCLEAPGALTGDHHRLKLAACLPAYAAQRWTAL